MTPVDVTVAFVAALRLVELAWSRRNERRLRARGGIEVGARHYPLFILLHAGWLVALWLTVPAATEPNAPLIAVFLALQVARVWVIASLGPYWTTRIITVPGAALVRRGPYRWLRHPNYVVVTLEITILPLAFGAWPVAVAFSVFNALLLRHRIGVEEAALAERRGATALD